MIDTVYLNTAVELASYAGQLVLRLIPLLFAAVFLAELAKLKLGEEKLRLFLAGRRPWTGRLRAVGLGALLPFCECGAFPVMLGLIRAGVPAGAVLSFFLVSPVVSMPAFMILIGLFGPLFAVVYLGVTVFSALGASFLLESAGRRWGIFREGVAVEKEKPSSPFAMVENSASCEKPGNQSCCSLGEAAAPVKPSGLIFPARLALSHAWQVLKKILPYALAAIVVASLVHTLVPMQLIEQALGAGAPYDILIAALAGIPLYTGDCTMIAVVAPLISATGAVGAGVAFIISGSGTSINGIIFMGSVFRRYFLGLYVFTVFCIALVSGFIISLIVPMGAV